MDQFADLITVSHPKSRKAEGWDSANLTPQEQDTLNGLVLAIQRYENPSLKEIAQCAGRSAEGTGYYPPTVHRYLRGLEQKGYVQLPARYRGRGIKVLKRG